MGDVFGFILVIAAFALIAVGFHYWISNPILAIIIPTIVVPFVLPLIDYLILGYVDPFAVVAVFDGVILMLVTSLLVSIPFKKRRQRKQEQG